MVISFSKCVLRASDGTTSDTVMVHIEVMGIDDNEPAFEKAEYVFNMFENATGIEIEATF